MEGNWFREFCYLLSLVTASRARMKVQLKSFKMLLNLRTIRISLQICPHNTFSLPTWEEFIILYFCAIHTTHPRILFWRSKIDSMAMGHPEMGEKAFTEEQTTNATCGLSPSGNGRNAVYCAYQCGLSGSGMLRQDITHRVSIVSYHSRPGEHLLYQASMSTLPLPQVAWN